jgi:hypothetical protein
VGRIKLGGFFTCNFLWFSFFKLYPEVAGVEGPYRAQFRAETGQ